MPGLDGDALPSFEELTGPPVDSEAVIEQVRHDLGVGARRVRYVPPGPDVQDLAEGLGLR